LEEGVQIGFPPRRTKARHGPAKRN
jgi:hypothetical protein